MNKIILIGNLGKDPDMSYTPNGTAVTKFTLAVSRKMKAASGSEMKEETEWFSIIVWRNLAEICNQYLKKGQKVYLEGRLTQRKYTDKEGIARMAVEVVVSEMEMLTPKNRPTTPDGDVDAFLAELETA